MISPNILWTPADSKNDLSARVSSSYVMAELQSNGANSWGFFSLPDGRYVTIGYADVGLPPTAIVLNGELVIGANELLAGFSLASGRRVFLYRMPSLFHEFVVLGDPLTVRDEIGFVCISLDGTERWVRLTNGPISQYKIDGASIIGTTIDGDNFSFSVP